MGRSNESRIVKNDYRMNTIEEKPNDNHYKKRSIYIEEALVETGFGIYNYTLVLIAGMILGAVFLETCGLSLVMPISQYDMDLTIEERGILGGVSFIGIICSSHLWGFLADTMGRKRVIQPTLIIAFFLSIASAFTDDFYVFATLRFLNGFFISGSSATIYAYLGEFHSDMHRSRSMMGSAFIYGIVSWIFPFLGFFIINQDWKFFIPFFGIIYKPWRFFLIVCSLPGLLASIALIFFPESPKFALGQGKQSETIETINQMHRWNNRNKSDVEIFEIREENESIEKRKWILKNKQSRFPLLNSIWSQTAPLFKPPFLGPTLLICVIQFGIYATCHGFYMFFPDILNRMATKLDSFVDDRIEMCDVINMNEANFTLSDNVEAVHEPKLELETLEHCIILESLYVIGYALSSLLVDKVGKYFIILFFLGLSGIGGILCTLSDIPAIQVACFICLMCCGMAGNVVSAAAVEIYPTSSRAMAMCVSLLFGRLGGVVGSNTVAYILSNYCELTFHLSGGSVIVCAILASFIPNIHQRASKLNPGPRTSILSIRT